jgi:hypothetical protein
MMKMMMIGEKGYPLREKKVGTPMKNQRGDKKVITNSISHLKIHDDNGIPLQKGKKEV